MHSHYGRVFGTSQAPNPEKNPGSFIGRCKHLWNGWYPRQRGFNRTDFWQGLRAAHRAVLEQLYGDVARQPRRWNGADLSLTRGQAAFSIADLAQRSGATPKQARLAVDRAVSEGVLHRDIISIVVDGHTQNISLVSWLDFDAYDSTAPAGEGQGKSVSGPEGKSAAVVSPDATTGYSAPPPDQGKSVSGPQGKCIIKAFTRSITDKGKGLSDAPRPTPLTQAHSETPSARTRRDYMRTYMQKRRAKERAAKAELTPSTPLTPVNPAVNTVTTPTTPTKKRKSPAKPTTDPRIRVLIDGFYAAYKKAHGRAYVVSGAKDGKLLKRLLAALDAEKVADPVAEILKAAETMLADPWGKPNASIGILCSQINRWRGGTVKPTPPGYKPSSSVGLSVFKGGVLQPEGVR